MYFQTVLISEGCLLEREASLCGKQACNVFLLCFSPTIKTIHPYLTRPLEQEGERNPFKNTDGRTHQLLFLFTALYFWLDWIKTFFFPDAENWIQGLVHSRHTPYHWATLSSMTWVRADNTLIQIGTWALVFSFVPNEKQSFHGFQFKQSKNFKKMYQALLSGSLCGLTKMTKLSDLIWIFGERSESQPH